MTTMDTTIAIRLIWLLLLCGCAQQEPWVSARIQTGKEAFTSSRLLYPTDDPVNGLDLELMRVQGKERAFLLVHSQAVPPFQGNEKEAYVALKVGSTLYQGTAYRHQGGQRLQLTDKMEEILVAALKNREPVTIEIAGFSLQVSAEEFLTNYEQFIK